LIDCAVTGDERNALFIVHHSAPHFGDAVFQ
jgi:hypothetical protein